jgi:AcrR family transcriptional regulator
MAQRSVTRREVLEVSRQLFAANGYRSTSLELVAKRLGVTRQALYYHFRSKGEILGALFDELMTKLEDGVAKVVPVAGEIRFNTLVRAHIEVTIANTGLMALLLHERPETDQLKYLHSNSRRRAYARLFTAAYEEGVADGVLVPLDPWVAVNTVIAAINGVSWWYHGEPRVGAGQAAEMRDRLESLLSHGYLAEPRTPLPLGTQSPVVTANDETPTP